MHARAILTILLGAFVIVALATIAKQAIQPAPRNDRPIVASAMPLADSARPAPIQAVPTAESTDAPEAAPPVRASRRLPDTERPSSGVVKEVEPAPVTRGSEARQRTTAPSHARKVVATYFHGNIRCATCRKVEAYAREAIDEGFQTQVAAGVVEFRAVNVDEAANRHFIHDFQLVTRSVVVTEEVDGAVARWVKLDNVWGLVGNRAAYLNYVQDAVRGYMEMQ
jgi:hypothetical protein